MAPEYASYGQLSDKVDVFSFGVLCLEVVSGRRNIDENLPPNQMYLSKWVSLQTLVCNANFLYISNYEGDYFGDGLLLSSCLLLKIEDIVSC